MKLSVKINNLIFGLLFFIVLVLFFVWGVSGAFAKFETNISSAESAYVAKWDIKLNGDKWSDNVSFNLFDYVGNSADLLSLNGEKLVAPGANGVLNFSVKNDSDVNAIYSVELITENDMNIPIEYKIRDGAWQVPTDNKFVLADEELLKYEEEVIIPISWRWAYDGSVSENFKDSQTTDSDTNFGIDADAKVFVKALVVAEQID